MNKLSKMEYIERTEQSTPKKQNGHIEQIEHSEQIEQNDELAWIEQMGQNGTT